MPYKNIHWIKLEKRLLNDYRFYTMSEESQLIFVKFLMLAAETNNKIPKNLKVVKSSLRSQLPEEKIQDCINEIKINFPKFKEHKDFYFIKEFDTRCNRVYPGELPGNSQGAPGVHVDKIRIDKIIKEYIHKKSIPLVLENGTPEEKAATSAFWKRNVRTAKNLAILSKGNTQQVIDAMEWFGGLCERKNLSWSLETIEKWFPDFMAKGKAIENIPESLREYLR